MADPNDISQIMATTIESRTKKLADNVTGNNGLLNWLNSKGKKETFSGGSVIMQELAYAENPTYKRYSGAEYLDISASDEFSSPSFAIKQIAMAVVMTGLEQLQNAGPEQQIDLLAAKLTNAERSFENGFSADIYSSGTADGGKQINGLQALISDDGTGTVGGINSSTWDWWQNQVYDFSTNGVTPSATTIQTAMHAVYMDTLRNRDHVDLWVADNNFYSMYWHSLVPQQRFVNESKPGAGWRQLQFMDGGGQVICDGGFSGECPTNHMYAINSNYLHYRPHKDRDVVRLDGKRFAVNQDAFVQLLAWAGNLTISNRQLQGVIVA